MSQVFYDLLKRIKNSNEADNHPVLFLENGGIDVTLRAEFDFDVGLVASQREMRKTEKTHLTKS